MAEMPEVPLTTEGSYVLHQMFRFARPEWRQQEVFHCDRIVQRAAETLAAMETGAKDGQPKPTAIYSLLGHKGDIMFVHFRDSLEDLHRAELAIEQMELTDFLEPTHSYLSVVELGLYESTAKTYAALTEKGIVPHTTEWNAGVAEVIARQSAAMASRLHPEIPPAKYICFYPMDRKRGEEKNWYQVPLAERQRMMHLHGMIGRRYADSVKQIISGSIGFDDWEWGVDLFADDPLAFKRLIYEMRFDEVSAVYAMFGSFYVGIRVHAKDLRQLLSGELP
jgi:chlorite dismutase